MEETGTECRFKMNTTYEPSIVPAYNSEKVLQSETHIWIKKRKYDVNASF